MDSGQEAEPVAEPRPRSRGVWQLALCALGVVFGDIGTSPLYTLKECLLVAGRDRPVEQADLFGILSLMFWALVMVVTVKYVVFVMRASHDGEGGILALLALVPERYRTGPRGIGGVSGMTLLAVAGAALLYGDGVITPAISVLSAVEGLAIASPELAPGVVPITCLILLGLFSIQKRGTGSVGRLFGPIMLVWFLTLAALGLWQISQRPDVLGALLPTHGVEFFQRHGLRGLLILGSVVLVVTGGEALYADMGHFGLVPIRRAWLTLVMPALVLAYLGQGALLLREPAAAANPFFAMVPAGAATYALVVLASLATIIASQALISGAFSLTRQAMLLGFLPRVTVRHTAYESEGQIYIPQVNVLLGAGCLALVLTFRESVKLAAAYGLAVTGTMVVTTVLYYLVIRHTWGWGRLRSLSVLVLFLAFDLPFLAANLFKFFDGGYVPMLIGSGLIAAMLIWSHGRTAVMQNYSRQYGPFETEWPRLRPLVVARVPGAAVFLATDADHVPPVLVHQIKATRTLHETVVLLTVVDAPQPEVPEAGRAIVEPLGDGFLRVAVRFGFMEQPLLIPCLRRIVAERGLAVDLDAATFFIGHSTIVADAAGTLAFIPEAIFAYLKRNAVREEQRYGLPAGQVMEIGEQISI
ncbi:MAG: potassium transporter Kup [Planctomycetia bacterium]|nr:potassium transporter Kup [Planctomycetia bacterium]